MDRLPSIEQAEAYLSEAGRLNPGKWVDHSGYVARAAQAIGREHPDIDAGKAYALGLIHDVGRRVGMRHIVEGYKLLNEEGFPDAARICLTHSFPGKVVAFDFPKWDCSEEECTLVRNFLSETDYNAYDRLLQLGDALGTAAGYCLMEKRMIDAPIRHAGEWDASQQVAKWTATFSIKEEMEKAIGCSIYQLLPGVVETTFEFSPGRIDS